MTVTQIANLALAKLGQYQISGFDDDDPTAEIVRTHYDVCRQQLLRSAPWSFATRRESTARLSEPESGPWSYAYQIPARCVQVLDVNEVDTMGAANPGFAIENGSIVTNDESCDVRYVYDEPDPNKYPSDFVEAFALLLASRMAAQITGNVEIGQALEDKAVAVSAKRAAAASVNESRGQRNNWMLESDLVNVRRWG